ncbi:unnamed protein product [Xylocopa violacea]|uniref:Transcription elongation factor, mitochondrial n=1 Tax=Xylocopa violacea TaxID=135666 RepID=A0ABP1NT71_XYLVO
MLRILSNLTFAVRIRKDLKFQPLRRCFTKTKGIVDNNVEQKWFSTNDDEILQIVNECKLKQLTKYIEPSYAEAIISNRTNNGPYKSLNDLISQNELTSEHLNNFYTLINSLKIRQKKWGKFVLSPAIKDIVMPKTVLGIHIGLDALTWTLLSSDLKILDWDCLIWHDTTRCINNIDLVNKALSFVQTLPLSSCYVVEEFKIRNRTLSYLLFIQQLYIAIICFLKLKESQGWNNLMESKNNICVLKYMASAHFFKLVVDDEVKHKFTTKSIEHQEQMGWSLVKALTLIRLVTIFNDNQKCRKND